MCGYEMFRQNMKATSYKYTWPVMKSVPRIEYPLGGSSKKGSHVYFLLQVFWVILLFDINVILMLQSWCPDVTIVESDVIIVRPWQLSTGSKYDYLFCYCPLVGILFEVLRIIMYVGSPIFSKHCSMFQSLYSWYFSDSSSGKTETFMLHAGITCSIHIKLVVY